MCIRDRSSTGVAQVLLSPANRDKSDGGFTLIELLIAVAIIGIVASIAVIALARARQSGNEASALGSMRAVISGQAAYASSCGGGGYAQSNADLGKEPTGSPAFISPDLEKADLATNAKTGYIVDINDLSLIHISEPTRLLSISYAVFCLKK